MMGIIERLCSDVITDIIHDKITDHVNDTCSGSFETSHIVSLLQVINNTQTYILYSQPPLGILGGRSF